MKPGFLRHRSNVLYFLSQTICCITRETRYYIAVGYISLSLHTTVEIYIVLHIIVSIPAQVKSAYMHEWLAVSWLFLIDVQDMPFFLTECRIHCVPHTHHTGRRILTHAFFLCFDCFLTVLFLFKDLLDCFKLLQDFFLKKGETKTWSYFYCVIFMLLQVLINMNYVLCYNDKKEHCIVYCLDNYIRCACLIFFSLNVFMFTFIDLY